MFRNSSLAVLAATILCSTAVMAKAPASAPAGTTGMCKDGSYTSAASKSGACSGHDGVKKWYGAPAEASAAPASSSSDKGASSGKTKSKAEPTEAHAANVAAPAAAPTGTCKDGTSTSAASKSGACSGHGGVKEWNAAAGASSAAAAAAPMSKAASAAAPAAAPAPPAAAPSKSTTYTPPAMPAPGGGQGQVWVNKPSKVYHCPNDKWYGKTKDGAYMSEANAIAQGNHADHGKACQ